MKSKLMHILPRFVAVGLITFWVLYVFMVHGFTFTAFIESSIWLVVLGATLIAWGSHVSGSVIFIVLGMIYWLMAREVFPLTTLLYVSGPLVLTGVLFLIDKLNE